MGFKAKFQPEIRLGNRFSGLKNKKVFKVPGPGPAFVRIWTRQTGPRGSKSGQKPFQRITAARPGGFGSEEAT
jgi:hypothetical protein